MQQRIAERTAGLVPGTPVLTDDIVQRTRLAVFDYGPDDLFELDNASVDAVIARAHGESVTWVDVVGLADVSLVQKLTEAFEVHPLSLEDIVDVTTRSKLDDYGDFMILILKLVHAVPVGERLELRAEQVSLVLGRGFVISFQEQEEDVFEPVRHRLRNSLGRIRNRGSDYLFYALVDAMVDGLMRVVEKVGEQVEIMEAEVLTYADDETPEEIHRLKQDMLFLRKVVAPQRDAIASAVRADSQLVGPRTLLFMRDALDHAEQMVDLVSMYREVSTGLLELYLSMVSHRTNRVMEVLTVLTALFAPPTFLAGLYGMNFQWMPELDVWFAYPLALAGMAMSSALVWLWLKSRDMV